MAILDTCTGALTADEFGLYAPPSLRRVIAEVKTSISRALHRNFMGYNTQQVSPLIGLGVSAISDSWEIFSQNEKVLETYRDRVAEGRLPFLRGHVHTPEDLVMRRHILNLMTSLETSWEPENLRTPHLERLSHLLQGMLSDHLVELGPQSCRIPEQGRPFLRNICMAFDARLERKAPGTALFSQTI